MSEEMVQETFLKMHRYRKSYEPRAAFRTYLYTVARSVLLNRWKSVLAARSPAPARPDAATDADQPDPEEQAVQRELLSRVEAAMHTLPESQRTALALVRYEGLSYEEAAETMKVSLAALKSLLNRARKELVEKVLQ
jgi:RNA polymerase sigma-70 factor (ECF subfamily)